MYVEDKMYIHNYDIFLDILEIVNLLVYKVVKN